MKTGRRFFLTVLLVASFMAGCQSRLPVRVGFAGELSGTEADLGVPGRNAVVLAVETINARGGIAGRPLEVIYRDDQGTPDGAVQADRELVAAGVVAVIGHMTSSQSIAGLEVTAPAGVVLFSPTSTSARLSGRKDLFFRIVDDNTRDTFYLAQRINDLGIKRLALLYDEDNAAYAAIYAQSVGDEFTRRGGQVVANIGFLGSAQPDDQAILAKLRSAAPDGLVIVASALNSALLVQHARLAQWNIPIFVSDWAYSDIFLHNGGKAIEGVELVTTYDTNFPDPDMREFQHRFKATYGYEPNFAAAQSFEVMLMLAIALEKTGGSAQGLPEALENVRDFKGLIGLLSMGPYGDVRRPLYLLNVQNSRFVTGQVLERLP